MFSADSAHCHLHALVLARLVAFLLKSSMRQVAFLSLDGVFSGMQGISL